MADRNPVALVDGELVTIRPPDMIDPNILVNDKNFVHDQSIAAAVWNINHNLDKRPAITLWTDTEHVMYASIVHVNNNTAEARFNGSLTGKASCN